MSRNQILSSVLRNNLIEEGIEDEDLEFITSLIIFKIVMTRNQKVSKKFFINLGVSPDQLNTFLSLIEGDIPFETNDHEIIVNDLGTFLKSIKLKLLDLLKFKRILSPRLRKLREDIHEGKKGSVIEFWKELEKGGTPLIEPIQNDSDHQLVTFITKADKKSDKFSLLLPLRINVYDRSLLTDHVFQRLENTDIFYKSLILRNGTRSHYFIVKNNPLFPVGINLNKGIYDDTFLTDLLNKKNYTMGKQLISYFEFSDAPLQPWINYENETARGEVKKYKLESKTLKKSKNRQFWVYTPPHYALDNKPYNVIIAFDGNLSLQKFFSANVTLDNLISKELIPPFVGIFLNNSEEINGLTSRMEDLGCNLDYITYIAKELIPWLRNNYNVSKNPKDCLAMGVSLGGLVSSYLALKFPEIIGNVLSHSGTYFWFPGLARALEPRVQFKSDPDASGWLGQEYIKSELLPVKFYIEMGSYESPETKYSNRHFRDILLLKGYSVDFRVYNGGHDLTIWRGTFADGLLSLFGKN